MQTRTTIYYCHRAATSWPGLVINDPLLEPLIAADNDTARDAVVESIVRRAEPLIQSIIGRYRGRLPPEVLEDIRSTVTLRILRRLRDVPGSEGMAIASLDDFVAHELLSAGQWFLSLLSVAAGLIAAAIAWRVPYIQELEAQPADGETADVAPSEADESPTPRGPLPHGPPP